MKLSSKICIVILVSVMITTIIYSCNKNDNFQNLNSQTTGKEFTKYGLEGISFSSALDSAGKWHNDYQELILTEILNTKTSFLDTTTFKNLVLQKSKSFFDEKGMKFTNQVSALKLGKATNLTFQYDKKNLSEGANSILNDFQNAIRKFTTYDIKFQNKLITLKQRALKLNVHTEIFEVGVPISIAIYSYKYWNENGNKWVTLLNPIQVNPKIKSRPVENSSIAANTVAKPIEADIDVDRVKKPCGISIWKLGGADAIGAVEGAMGGSALGLGGALAGGILTSAVASLGNLSNQVISCNVSWWPF
ncbi:hypothetical protein ACQ33O_01630 [Ferruginibacter sp. SUN002]|uniref:hypothetical protein n=1 Tax=Ferruginibacter sp. SUN002 TaxID=2937789 RepID=UPI003D366971